MLILLDMDGVMIPTKGWKVPDNHDDGFPMFSEKAVIALRSLITNDTQIILTTSHRDRFTLDKWKEIFERRGVPLQRLDRLPPNPNLEKKRADEIVAWFKDQESSMDYIIIDDDKSLNSLPEHLKQRLILTSPMIGLTSADTESL